MTLSIRHSSIPEYQDDGEAGYYERQPEYVNLNSHEKLEHLEFLTQELVKKSSSNTYPKEFLPIAEAWGVDVSQVERVKRLWKLSMKLHRDGPLGAMSVPDSNGVHFLKNTKGKIVGVFKPGSKRACTDNAVMIFAQALGLDGHFGENRPAVLKFSPLAEEQSESEGSAISKELSDSEPEEEIPIETWSGKVALYTKPEKLLGVVSQYIANPPEMDKAQKGLAFAKMVMLLVAAGTRDVKKEDLVGECVVIDAGDSFPKRNDPLPGKLGGQPCQTDMPFLDYTSNAKEILDKDQLSALATIVSHWGKDKIISALSFPRIRFADLHIERSEEGEESADQAGVPYSIEKQSSAITDPNELTTDGNQIVSASLGRSFEESCSSDPQPMLREEQKAAAVERVGRIRQFIQDSNYEARNISPIDIVKEVDKYFAMLHEKVKRAAQVGRNTPNTILKEGRWSGTLTAEDLEEYERSSTTPIVNDSPMFREGSFRFNPTPVQPPNVHRPIPVKGPGPDLTPS